MTCQLLSTQNVFPSHEVENIRVAIIILMQCSFCEKGKRKTISQFASYWKVFKFSSVRD